MLAPCNCFHSSLSLFYSGFCFTCISYCPFWHVLRGVPSRSWAMQKRNGFVFWKETETLMSLVPKIGAIYIDSVIDKARNTPTYLWLYSPLFDLGHFLSFLIFYKVGRTPWKGDQPVTRPLFARRTVQTRNKPTQTSIPEVRFEPTIPMF
jgi:hypothetical protein